MSAGRILPLRAARVRAFETLAVAGVALLAAGTVVDPRRAWANVLFASYALVCLGLAGAFFVALQYLSFARWSVVLRRVPEAMTAALPVGALGLAAVLVGRPSLYPWHAGHLHDGGGYMGFKAAWLSQPAFLIRAALYLAAWLVLSALLVRNSRRQDASGDPAFTRRNVALSAAFMVVFSVTFWLASQDWIMSLEPDWYSTMFGVYCFSGLFSSGLAAITLLVVWLRGRGTLPRRVTADHTQDLGSLMVGFTTFWAYIWFCQFMLIWYANLPEETVHFVRRLEGGWQLPFFANVALNWIVPFLLLLPLPSKRDPRTLVIASVVILVGRAVDLHLMIAPSVLAGGPSFGPWELGALLATAGLFGASFMRALGRAALVPAADPWLPPAPGHDPARAPRGA